MVKKIGLGLLCFTMGLSGQSIAADKALKKEVPQDKRRLEGESADSPRLMRPLDVFDEPARQNFSTLRQNQCPKDEAYDWGRLQGATGIDSTEGVAAACGRVFTAGYAQGQFGAQAGQGANDIVVRSVKPDGTTDWLKYFGTTPDSTKVINDQATAITTAPTATPCTATTVYVTGYTGGNLAGVGSFKGGADVFLAAYNSTTGAELWRIQLGTAGNDYAYGITTDSAGNIYVVGSTTGKLDLTSTRTPPTGTTDLFIAKYSPTGTFIWARQAGVNTKSTIARGVSAGANGLVYVTGYTTGALNSIPYKGGGSDLFVTSYTDTGTLQNTVLPGTSGTDYGYGVVTAQNGANTVVYVTGQTNGAYPGTTNKGNYDIVTAKLNATLGTTLWLTQEGSPLNDYAYSIAYSPHGEVLVAGSSEIDFRADANLGSSDMLMLDYDAQTGVRLFSEHIGGPVREVARAIAVDEEGRIFLAGSTDGPICDSAPGGIFSGGFFDSILVQLNNGCHADVKDPRCPPGGGSGDPHYTTFDQLYYDFQGAGDFVLTSVEGDTSFELQARQCLTAPTSSVATFQATAARVGSNRIEISANGTLWLNGTATTVTAPVPLTGGGKIYRSGGAHVVAWPSGERLLAYAYGGHMNLFLLAPRWRLPLFRGLLGNGDGSKDNEFQMRDGTGMRPIPAFAELYRGPESLANQWRVNPAMDSVLFQHGTDCTDLNAPLTFVSTSTLTPAQKAQGEAACANVADPALHEDCIMDVGASGNPIFAETLGDLLDRRTKGGMDGEPITKVRGVYFNNFTGDIGTEWDSITSNVTPLGSQQFLGEFGNQNVRLTLNNLGNHTKLSVSFDLYIINAWTGDAGYFGSPTSWKVSADGQEHINATFSNWNGTMQSYPFSGMQAQEGSIERNSLGYPFGDSIYRITLDLDHTSSTLALDMAAEGLSGLIGEGWGVANFEIQGR